MANYYGQGRSNYVKVTDVDKFKDICDRRNLIFWEEGETVACGANSEHGEPETFGYNETTGEEFEYPPLENEVSEILVPGQVFIWMHVGNEKLRYLSGYAVATNWQGKTEVIDINDIYEKSSHLGVTITHAEY